MSHRHTPGPTSVRSSHSALSAIALGLPAKGQGHDREAQRTTNGRSGTSFARIAKFRNFETHEPKHGTEERSKAHSEDSPCP